jgi:hypothetical protein
MPCLDYDDSSDGGVSTDPNATSTNASTDPNATSTNASTDPNACTDPNATTTNASTDPNASSEPNACTDPDATTTSASTDQDSSTDPDDGGSCSVARGGQNDNSVAPPSHDTYPDLPLTPSSGGPSYTVFSMQSAGYQLTIVGAINYVQGWIQFLISLGATVPAATGGSAGVNFGNNPGSFSGTDWRFAQQSTSSPSGYQYWDGSAWQNVPAAWSDPTNTLLYPIGIWSEGGVNKAQMGNTWPSAIPAWGATENALCASTLPTWTSTIQSVWSNAFDIKRDQCPSSDPQCCRYHPVASVSFTQVNTRSGSTIVLAANNARSNSGAWSMGDNRVNMPAHEFGHHLGNGDEYTGGVTVTIIDPDSIMGQNMTVVKTRHFGVIIQVLSSMVDTAAAQSTGFTYTAVAGLSGGGSNASQ